MRKVKFTLSLGMCKIEEIVTFDDDITEEEIQEEYEQWQLEQLDGGWEDVD